MGGINPPYEFVEKRFVTPAKAGVQKIKINKIINMLDSGFRRNDGFGCFSDFFNKLLETWHRRCCSWQRWG